MILVENIPDLRQILRNPALFSKDPVFLHFPESPPPDLPTSEKHLNALKKKNSLFPGIRMALTALAVLSCLYLNTAYTSEKNLVRDMAILSGLSAAAGMAGGILHRRYLKMMIRREVKKLLKQLYRLQPGRYG